MPAYDWRNNTADELITVLAFISPPIFFCAAVWAIQARSSFYKTSNSIGIVMVMLLTTVPFSRINHQQCRVYFYARCPLLGNRICWWVQRNEKSNRSHRGSKVKQILIHIIVSSAGKRPLRKEHPIALTFCNEGCHLASVQLVWDRHELTFLSTSEIDKFLWWAFTR